MAEATMNAAAPARRCLDFIRSYWDEQGWELPERTYLAAGHPGAIALDSEECLYVALSKVEVATQIAAAGSPSPGAGAQQMMSATYVVRMMRRCPSWDEGDPEADELTAAALSTLLDAGRMAQTLFAWRARETEPRSRTARFWLGEITSEGPMGFSAGHSVPFTIAPVQ